MVPYCNPSQEKKGQKFNFILVPLARYSLKTLAVSSKTGRFLCVYLQVFEIEILNIDVELDKSSYSILDKMSDVFNKSVLDNL